MPFGGGGKGELLAFITEGDSQVIQTFLCRIKGLGLYNTYGFGNTQALNTAFIFTVSSIT